MKNIIVLFFCFLSFFLRAQSDQLIPVFTNGQSGFININGEVVIPLKYKSVLSFQEGLAGVREHGLYGFIDTSGQYVLPPKYDYVDAFDKGLAKVWIDGKCRIIDRTGRPLFEGDYKEIKPQLEEKTLLVKTHSGKKGLVDFDGAIVIDTIYDYLSDFKKIHDDRDAVKHYYRTSKRKIGDGLLSRKGKVIIPLGFDEIKILSKDLIVAEQNDKVRCTDGEGNILIDTIFKQSKYIGNNTVLIVTETDKVGIVQLEQEALLLDTIYFNRKNNLVYDNLIVLENDKKEVGLFTFTGENIVPFGIYNDFSGFNEQYGLVLFNNLDDDTLDIGIIDTLGQLLKRRQFTVGKYDFPFYHALDGDHYITLKDTSYDYHYLNVFTGEEVKRTTVYPEKINPWVLTVDRVKKAGQYGLVGDDGFIQLYNPKGELVSDKIFEDVNFHEYFLKDGTCEVAIKTDEDQVRWGVIDTTGKFVLPPIYPKVERLENSNHQTVGTNLYVVEHSIEDSYSTNEGVYDIDKQAYLIPPDFSYLSVISLNTTHNTEEEFYFIAAYDDDFDRYYNMEGQLIWQNEKSRIHSLAPTPKDIKIIPLNMDGQLRAWYSQQMYRGKDVKNLKYKYQLPTDQVSIIVDTTVIDTFAKRYFGNRAYIVNNTEDTITFNTQDGRIHLMMQAKNKNSVWVDIDYLPNSWCGNSYNYAPMSPYKYWSYTIPKYEGSIKTELRMKLKLAKIPNWEAHGEANYKEQGIETNPDKWIYSEPFEGYINPAQLWREVLGPRWSLYK